MQFLYLKGSASLERRTASTANGPASGDMNDGKWSGEASRKGGFRVDDQQVSQVLINFFCIVETLNYVFLF